MEKLDQTKVPILKQDIERVLKYLGHVITEKDFPEYNPNERTWRDRVFKGNRITLIEAGDPHDTRYYCYAEYDGEPVFFYDSEDESNSVALYSEKFNAALKPLIRQSIKLEDQDPEVIKERKARIRKRYMDMARTVAFQLGIQRVKRADEYYDYYEHYFEDEKLIIRADDMVDLDMEVYIKMKEGVHLVLDDRSYLAGSWTKYLLELFCKAEKIRSDDKNGFINDKEIFQ